MTRGLLWLPLLVVFIWLAWAGWNEYQKLEAYRTWAQQFDRAKYDIYAVLGQKDSLLTWGKPTRKGAINLQSFSLQQVKAIDLLVDQQRVELENPPAKGRDVALEFRLADSDIPICVPFTEISLAAQWGNYLRQEWQQLQASSLGSGPER
jgi:hypothetical protein